MNQPMNTFHQIHMPQIICGRGSLSFAASLGRKRIAVIGYDDSVKELAEKNLQAWIFL